MRLRLLYGIRLGQHFLQQIGQPRLHSELIDFLMFPVSSCLTGKRLDVFEAVSFVREL